MGMALVALTWAGLIVHTAVSCSKGLGRHHCYTSRYSEYLSSKMETDSHVPSEWSFHTQESLKLTDTAIGRVLIFSGEAPST